jgi:hypothetical protein
MGTLCGAITNINLIDCGINRKSPQCTKCDPIISKEKEKEGTFNDLKKGISPPM